MAWYGIVGFNVPLDTDKMGKHKPENHHSELLYVVLCTTVICTIHMGSSYRLS